MNSSRTAAVRLFQFGELCHAVQAWAHGLQTCTPQVITDKKTNSTAVVLFRGEKDIIETNLSFSTIVQSQKTEQKKQNRKKALTPFTVLTCVFAAHVTVNACRWHSEVHVQTKPYIYSFTPTLTYTAHPLIPLSSHNCYWP